MAAYCKQLWCRDVKRWEYGSCLWLFTGSIATRVLSHDLEAVSIAIVANQLLPPNANLSHGSIMTTLV